MVRVCAFPGCFNREKAIRLRPVASSQEESMTFHTLPLHDPERLKLWLLINFWMNRPFNNDLLQSPFDVRNLKKI
uniref:THAP-type domain-containing protein n=1 Tax=Sinocyclocheilus anshuiensis TaxID=1608454 RepID=A0A671RK18_9TELE